MTGPEKRTWSPQETRFYPTAAVLSSHFIQTDLDQVSLRGGIHEYPQRFRVHKAIFLTIEHIQDILYITTKSLTFQFDSNENKHRIGFKSETVFEKGAWKLDSQRSDDVNQKSNSH